MTEPDASGQVPSAADRARKGAGSMRSSVASTASDSSAIVLRGADKYHVALPASLSGGGKGGVRGRI